MSKNKLDFTLMHVKAKIVLLPPPPRNEQVGCRLKLSGRNCVNQSHPDVFRVKKRMIVPNCPPWVRKPLIFRQKNCIILKKHMVFDKKYI